MQSNKYFREVRVIRSKNTRITPLNAFKHFQRTNQYTNCIETNNGLFIKVQELKNDYYKITITN